MRLRGQSQNARMVEIKMSKTMWTKVSWAAAELASGIDRDKDRERLSLASGFARVVLDDEYKCDEQKVMI